MRLREGCGFPFVRGLVKSGENTLREILPPRGGGHAELAFEVDFVAQQFERFLAFVE